MVDIGAIKLPSTTLRLVTTDLFHIIAVSDWEAALDNGVLEPPSLAAEGFIHLSAHHQILRPANLLYRGRTDLVLLRIDAAKLDAELVWEPGSHGEAEDFPHLYGALNVDAVRGTISFPCGDDGGFVLPPELAREG